MRSKINLLVKLSIYKTYSEISISHCYFHFHGEQERKCDVYNELFMPSIVIYRILIYFTFE